MTKVMFSLSHQPIHIPAFFSITGSSLSQSAGSHFLPPKSSPPLSSKESTSQWLFTLSFLSLLPPSQINTSSFLSWPITVLSQLPLMVSFSFCLSAFPNCPEDRFNQVALQLWSFSRVFTTWLMKSSAHHDLSAQTFMICPASSLAVTTHVNVTQSSTSSLSSFIDTCRCLT